MYTKVKVIWMYQSPKSFANLKSKFFMVILIHCIVGSFVPHFDIVFEVQWCLFVGPSSPLGGAETGTVGWESPRVRNWWASSVLFPLSSRCMTSKSLSITKINNWMFELQNWTFKMYNTWKKRKSWCYKISTQIDRSESL